MKHLQNAQACRICNSTEHLSFMFTKGHSHLYACNYCGFTQVINKPSDTELDEIYSSAYFSHSKYSDTSTLNREHLRRFKLMQRYIRNGSKILDYGCAAGEFIGFAGRSFDMYGMDPSEVAIRKAKTVLPSAKHRLVPGTIHEADYPSDFFDGIVLWDVIEHLWNPLDDCGRLLTFLKPKGYLFISTPNIGTIIAKILGQYWAFMTPPEHLGFFNKQAIIHLFQSNLNCFITEWRSRGKWVNVGFVMYKANRVLPGILPRYFMRWFQRGPLSRLSVYIPTGDIQYAVIKKL
jgi:2-polyprenyl-3-methyl-5-hydroxy-6-metoxy-1,4-benzoquinol methylase